MFSVKEAHLARLKQHGAANLLEKLQAELRTVMSGFIYDPVDANTFEHIRAEMSGALERCKMRGEIVDFEIDPTPDGPVINGSIVITPALAQIQFPQRFLLNVP